MRIAAQQALDALHAGARLYVPGSVSEPRALLLALAARPEAASGVHVVTSFVPGLNRLAAKAFVHAASVTVFMSGPPLAEALAPRVRYVPLAWSSVSAWLQMQRFDQAWFQACLPKGGECSLGLGADFVQEVAPRAARVVVELNPLLPPTTGHEPLALDARFETLESTEPIFTLASPPPDDVSNAIAAQVASLVRDGDILQVGVGKLMSCAVRALRSHRRLRIHSGVIGDEVFELIACGVVCGAAITAGIAGSRAAHDALRAGAPVEVKPGRYTHDADVLAAQDRLVALNGALEVDLLGQVNVECARGRRVSSPGGFPDFIRGAQRAYDGRAIVLLQSMAGDGSSRIVPRLTAPAAATTADALTVITEYGMADLRGLDQAARAAALVAIAAPGHRDALEREMASLV